MKTTPNIDNYPFTKDIIKNLRCKYIEEENHLEEYQEELKYVQEKIKIVSNYYMSSECSSVDNYDILYFLSSYKKYLVEYKYGQHWELYLKEMNI